MSANSGVIYYFIYYKRAF